MLLKFLSLTFKALIQSQFLCKDIPFLQNIRHVNDFKCLNIWITLEKYIKTQHLEVRPDMTEKLLTGM